MEKEEKNKNDNKNTMNNAIKNLEYINSYQNKLSSYIGKILSPQYFDVISKMEIQDLKINNLIKDIIPKDYSQILYNSLIQDNYMNNLVNGFNNSYINNMEQVLTYETKYIEKILKYQNTISYTLEQLSKELINYNYIETIKTCLEEFSKSEVNLNEIIFNNKFYDYSIENDIKKEKIEEKAIKFDDKDKFDTIQSVKEIVDILEKKEGEYERTLYNKINSIKQEHPIIAIAIYEVFWIIMALFIGNIFTRNSNQTYINNYTTNNYTTIEDSNTDFINNARYVNARKLNVRSGPSKDFDIIDSLKWGTLVKIIDKTNYWTRIQHKGSTGKITEGWVYSRYLEEFDIDFLTE